VRRFNHLLFGLVLAGSCLPPDGTGSPDGSIGTSDGAVQDRDGGARADAGSDAESDAGTESDAGSGSDAGTHTDAGASADGGAGPGTDAGPGSDGGFNQPDGSVLGHPYGAHGGYTTSGVLFPTGTQAELDAAAAAFYDTWKSRYLKSACAAGQFLVVSSPATSQWTVSEGHGYGMIFAVVMAGHDPDARELFDGLYAYVADHRDPNGLMAWAQNKQCRNVDGVDSATDGDLDIAYALLLADRQWGSRGAIDYLGEAKKFIAAILAWDIHPKNSILVGDWVDASDSHYAGTRPSDFMPGHFKAFVRASGVSRWNDVVDKTYAVASYLQDHSAPDTGLLPDFAIGAPSATPSPAPADWLEGTDDGHYAWNACRTPWRLATDYLLSGDTRSQAVVRKMTVWARVKTGNDPKRIRDGYDLGGKELGSGLEFAFLAPFGVAAMVEAQTGSNQAWLDAIWKELLAGASADYFGDSIKLMALLTMSGNWWAP
jgi:endoglucanase